MLIPGELDLQFSSIKKLFAVPASLVIIALKKEILNWLTCTRIKIITSVYALCSLSQTLLGSLVGNFTAKILHRNGTDYQFRGANSLTTEPSFAGHIACAFLILYLVRRNMDGVRCLDKLIIINICAIALCSKSATGLASFAIVFLGALLIRTVLKISIKRIAVAVLFIVVLFLLVSAIPRITGLFQLVKTAGILAILNDASFAARILQPYFGFLSLLEYPFGKGIGSATGVYQAKFLEFSSQFPFNEYAYNRLLFEMRASVSVLGQYLIEVGCAILILLATILSTIKGDYKFERVIFVVLSILQSHSFLYPFIWLLAGKIKK